MNILFTALTFFASLSSAQNFDAPDTEICITVYTGDVAFARVALEAASEQKDLFNVESLKLERVSGGVVVYIKGSDGSDTDLNLEIRMKQDCGTGKAVVLSITGPTILI